MAKHNQAKFRALANMGDILIKMNNLEEAVKVCASYCTGSHTPQRQTVRYVLPREVRQRLTARDLIPRSIRLSAVCETPRSETSFYYAGSHTWQRQNVRYMLPREVRQRLTTRDLIPRSVRLCGMCYTAK